MNEWMIIMNWFGMNIKFYFYVPITKYKYAKCSQKINIISCVLKNWNINR